MNEITTISEAKEFVLENEDSVESLISPSDLIHQDIDKWENADIERLKDELYGSMDVWTYGIDHPYGNMIESIAITQFLNDIPRIRFDHLVFDDITECVVNGYWPYGSELGDNNPNMQDMREYVYEVKENIDYFHEYETEIRMEIESFIIEARLKNLE